MDLKFREDKFWFALATSTILLFILPGIIIDKGDYFLFYLLCWAVYGYFNFTAWNEGHPKKEDSRHFNPIDRVIWLEERVNEMNPTKEYVEELSHLKEKYKSQLKDIKKARDKREKEKRDQQEFLKRSLEGNNGVLYGSFVPQIICPHCQTKGKVKKKMKQRVEESREKGIIGATIGRKTITKKGSYTQLHCDKCKVTWEA